MFNGILLAMAAKLCVKNAQLLLFIMKLFVCFSNIKFNILSRFCMHNFLLKTEHITFPCFKFLKTNVLIN